MNIWFSLFHLMHPSLKWGGDPLSFPHQVLKPFKITSFRWLFRVVLVAALVASLVSAALNLVLVPLVNLQALGTWEGRAAEVLHRKVGGGQE